MTDILPKNPHLRNTLCEECWQQGQDDMIEALRPILENIKHRIWADELPDSPAWDTIYMQIEQILKESE